MGEERVGRLLAAVAGLAWLLAVAAALGSLGWPIVHDAALMHYVGWRLWEGDRPYVDVLDVNLPATHLFHMLWHGAFGTSASAWRALDLVVLGAGCAGVAGLLRPSGRAVAALGAALVALLHLHLGAIGVGQRDFFVGVLEVLAAWGLVAWAERGASRAVLPAVGLALGVAVAVKPTASIFLVLATGVALVGAARRGRPIAPALGALGGGVVAVAAVVLGWVASLGVLDELVAFWTTYMPLYRRVTEPSLAELLLRLRETPSAALLPLAPLHLWAVRREQPVAAGVIVAGLLAAAAHFVLQGKGYTYHLEPWALFLVPAGLIALQRAWDAVPWRTVGPATLAAACLAGGISAGWALTTDSIDPVQDRAARSLAARLRPGERVFVMDLSEGGLQALLAARVPQQTRFLYDVYFFHDLEAPVIRGYREELVASLRGAPPDRVVVFEHAWPARTYARLDNFPELRAWLRERYALETEVDGYRVYARQEQPARAGGDDLPHLR